MKKSLELDRRFGLTMALSPVSLLVPPAAASVVTWLTSVNPISLTALVCSYVILQCAWGSYLSWSKRPTGLPIFGIIASVYWIFFSAALFWGERRIAADRIVPVDEEYVTRALEMALVGVICMWAGMRLPLNAPSVRNLPDIDGRAGSSWAYLRVVLVVATLVGVYSPSVYWLGVNGRNIMTILTTMIPTTAFLLIIRRCWQRTASPIDKPLIIAIGLVHVGGGLSSGWLGSVVNFGLTVGAFYVVIHRRIPWTAIVMVIASTFFLQVGKNEFRAVYWNTDASGDPIERAEFWLETSASSWLDALQRGGHADSGELASRTLERASLLSQVAHVLEVTPSQIPYQGGQTYSYLAITLIPRFLWPDKPTVNVANQYYQVAYGLTDTRNLDSVSIAVGSMAEAYINFGWLGVVGIMTAIGMMLRVYESMCKVDHSNTLVLAIVVGLLPQLLMIESQLGQYVAGLIQQIVLNFSSWSCRSPGEGRGLAVSSQAD